MTVTLGKRVRLDADNACKVGIDALVNAGVIHSDAFVVRATANVIKTDRDNPHTDYKVTLLENK